MKIAGQLVMITIGDLLRIQYKVGYENCIVVEMHQQLLKLYSCILFEAYQ